MGILSLLLPSFFSFIMGICPSSQLVSSVIMDS